MRHTIPNNVGSYWNPPEAYGEEVDGHSENTTARGRLEAEETGLAFVFIHKTWLICTKYRAR